MPIKAEYEALSPKERVIAAGKALLRRGESATQDKIRAEIGGSSDGTINKYLPSLHQEVAKALDLAPLVTNLPPAVRDTFADALTTLFEQATEAAYTRARSEQEHQESVIKDLQAEIADLQAEAKHSEQQYAQSMEKIGGLNVELEEARSRVLEEKDTADQLLREKTALESENAQRERELQSLNGQVRELDQLLSQADERNRTLQSEINRSRAELEKCQASESVARSQAQDLQERLHAETSSLRRQLEEQRVENAKLEARHGQVSETIAELRAQFDETKVEHSGVLKEIETRHSEQTRALNADLATLQKHCTQLERENAVLQQKLSDTDGPSPSET